MIKVDPVIGPGAIDAARPAAKKAAAVLGWAVSGGSDVLLVWQITRHVWYSSQAGQPMPTWLILAALAGGLALFALITGGQIFTIGRSRGAYRAFLLIDLAISAWGMAPALAWLAGWFVPAHIARAVAGVLSSFIGLAAAKLPELLIFGDLRSQKGVD